MDGSNPSQNCRRPDAGVRSTRLAAAGSHRTGRSETPQVAVDRGRCRSRGRSDRNCGRDGRLRRVEDPGGDFLDDSGSDNYAGNDNDHSQAHNHDRRAGDHHDGGSDYDDNTRHSPLVPQVTTTTQYVPPPPAYVPPKTTEPAYIPPPVKVPDAGVYYANCSAVKAAGAAPIYRGDPGYSSKLDRDNDGVACE